MSSYPAICSPSSPFISQMGRAPLHYAAALDAMNKGRKETGEVGWYQLLLEAGADETVKDSVRN